jgi:hypothetical protein
MTWRARLAEAARMCGGLLAVTAATAALLALVDAVPAWLAGDDRGVLRARTVDEAERRLRTRLVMPSYFPDTLAWPPRAVRFTLREPGAAALHVDGRDGRPRALIAETVRPGAIPERLVPAGAPLGSAQVSLGGREGTLTRVVGEDGDVWNELAWEQGGRSLLLRSRGSIDELVRMAKSAREVP